MATQDKDLQVDTSQLKKRERNREAAYKSRQKHTQRADALHQEYETLEKSNAELRKEVERLQQEQAHWEKVLQQHEKICLLHPENILDLLISEPLFSTNDTNQVMLDF